MASAAWPLQEAVDTALIEDAGVNALVGDRIHSGIAPEGQVPDYIVHGNSVETQSATFARGGTRNVETIHLWTSADEGKRRVMRLYEAVDKALTGKQLPIAEGNTMLIGWTELTAVLLDPDSGFMHGIVTYTARTQKT